MRWGKKAGTDPANARLQDIERQNAACLRQVKRFRSDLAAGRAKAADFEKLKQQYPYYGILPCRTADTDFVLFHAHDDVIAWRYLWLGKDAYEAEILRTWVSWCKTPGVVLDIGGYSGLMTVLAGLAHPKNRIHLFEPIDRTIERAMINIRLNGLQSRAYLHNMAVSDRSGEQRINCYRPENFLGTGNSLHEKPGKEVIFHKTIHTVDLDSYQPGLNPSVVKIDVEGHELACLRGMRKILERSRPKMIIEIWDHDRAEVLKLLKDIGYTLERCEAVDLPVNNYLAVP